MYSLKKFFCNFPGHYLAACILAVAVGLFRYFTLPEGLILSYLWYEVLSVSGYVVVLVGALFTVSYYGAFDLFGYVFSTERSKYKNYVDYSEQKYVKRAREGYFFVPYYVVGIAIVIISRFFS